MNLFPLGACCASLVPTLLAAQAPFGNLSGIPLYGDGVGVAATATTIVVNAHADAVYPAATVPLLADERGTFQRAVRLVPADSFLIGEVDTLGGAFVFRGSVLPRGVDWRSAAPQPTRITFDGLGRELTRDARPAVGPGDQTATQPSAVGEGDGASPLDAAGSSVTRFSDGKADVNIDVSVSRRHGARVLRCTRSALASAAVAGHVWASDTASASLEDSAYLSIVDAEGRTYLRASGRDIGALIGALPPGDFWLEGRDERGVLVYEASIRPGERIGMGSGAHDGVVLR